MGDAFHLQPQIHELEEKLLAACLQYGQVYGIFMEASPTPITNLKEGATIKFGNCQLEMIHTPGHSPGSICFWHKESDTLIGGDVLFSQSIGRTDLPGGDTQTLLRALEKNYLFCLGRQLFIQVMGQKQALNLKK